MRHSPLNAALVCFRILIKSEWYLKMEELVSAFFRAVGSVLKVIAQLKLVELVGYSVGWVVAKTFTLGSFPSSSVTDPERVKVNYIGLLSILLCLAAIALLNRG